MKLDEVKEDLPLDVPTDEGTRSRRKRAKEKAAPAEGAEAVAVAGPQRSIADLPEALRKPTKPPGMGVR